jgi:hypothetical protein
MAMKQAIMQYGPISVAVHANSAMQAYNGGIFNGCANGEINHGVVLVGWDDDQGTDGVWIMRNSWGTGWGEDGGYMRMPYGCSYIGYGACYVDYAGMAGLSFDYPSGVPTILAPDQPTTFQVVVEGESGGVPVSGTGQLHYVVEGGTPETVSMTETSPNQYDAVLPAVSCGLKVEFYVSAEEATDGRIYDPDPASPNLAMSASQVEVAFEDDFETDKGWTVSGDATDGQWDRGVPVGGGDRGDPPTDFDGSGQCYLTDNVDGDSDVDDGSTYLESPVFDLSDADGLIHYARWYSNDFGSNPNNDLFRIYISNDGGGSWAQVESVGPIEQASGGWFENSFWVSDFVTPTSQMKLRFNASDLINGSVVEAGVDDVLVTRYACGAPPPPAILTVSLPDWTAAHPYSEQLEATGGVGEYTWTDKLGDLDGSGLLLSTDGILSGVPASSGAVSFTAMVTDEESNTDERLFGFDINPALAITFSPLPDWTVGIPYSQNLEATGGTGGRTWVDKYAELEGTGLSLSASGQLSGTITSAEPISFTAEVTDEVGASSEQLYEFLANAAVAVTTESMPAGSLTVSYSHQLEANGGTGTRSWSNPGEDLDGTGLTLSPEGLLTGDPAALGIIDFTVRVEDECGSFEVKPLSLTVVEPFMCGDVNGDEKVNLSDVTILIDYVYLQGQPPVPFGAGNVDFSPDGKINLTDVTRLINYVYVGGEELTCW